MATNGTNIAATRADLDAMEDRIGDHLERLGMMFRGNAAATALRFDQVDSQFERLRERLVKLERRLDN